MWLNFGENPFNKTINSSSVRNGLDDIGTVYENDDPSDWVSVWVDKLCGSTNLQGAVSIAQ